GQEQCGCGNPQPGAEPVGQYRKDGRQGQKKQNLGEGVDVGHGPPWSGAAVITLPTRLPGAPLRVYRLGVVHHAQPRPRAGALTATQRRVLGAWSTQYPSR